MTTATLFTILGMAAVTYLTRVGGYLFLQNRTLGPRMKAVLDAAPGCVLIAVIAPDFASGHLPDLAALGITLFAATRLSLLPTVIVAVAAAAVLRHAASAVAL